MLRHASLVSWRTSATAAPFSMVVAAAPTIENGAAIAEGLALTGEAWRSMGPHAKEIYVIQHLEELIGAVVESVHKIKVREVHILDPGDGSGIASYAASFPHTVAAVLSALRETTGVDIPAILAGASANGRTSK